MNPDRSYRGLTAGRPVGVPLPPAVLPLRRAGRWRKAWRYVGVYGPEVMLCVGAARIGPSAQVWWAVWDREGRVLHERTRMALGRGRVRVGRDHVHVDDGTVAIDLILHEGPGLEIVTPDPGGYAWTRKYGAAAVHGTVRAGGRRWNLDGPAFIDDSAGYHPRHTAWRWSAGTGRDTAGRAVVWNLVDGVHDSPQASERTVWVDGEPRELGPNAFAADLSSVAFAEGGSLAFSAEAVRRRDDDLWLFRSTYEQPFGTFTGTFPGGVELAAGYGVMEHHDVHW
ncbi:MAG: DUF2804 domain-containing protein [Solirubrobacteraceae bacterium]